MAAPGTAEEEPAGRSAGVAGRLAARPATRSAQSGRAGIAHRGQRPGDDRHADDGHLRRQAAGKRARRPRPPAKAAPLRRTPRSSAPKTGGEDALGRGSGASGGNRVARRCRRAHRWRRDRRCSPGQAPQMAADRASAQHPSIAHPRSRAGPRRREGRAPGVEGHQVAARVVDEAACGGRRGPSRARAISAWERPLNCCSTNAARCAASSAARSRCSWRRSSRRTTCSSTLKPTLLFGSVELPAPRAAGAGCPGSGSWASAVQPGAGLEHWHALAQSPGRR